MTKFCVALLSISLACLPCYGVTASQSAPAEVSAPSSDSQTDDIKIETKEDLLKNYPFKRPVYETKPAARITQEQLNSEFSFRYGDWLQPGLPDQVGATFFVKRINKRIFRIEAIQDNPELKPYEYDAAALGRMAMYCLPMDIAFNSGYDAFAWVEKTLPNDEVENHLFLLRKNEVLKKVIKQYPHYKLSSDTEGETFPAAPPILLGLCNFYKSHLMQ